MMAKIWYCKIGEIDTGLPPAADIPMREAVANAYHAVTGQDPDFLFSGWGAQLEERERAVVEDRLPAPTPEDFTVHERFGGGLEIDCPVCLAVFEVGPRDGTPPDLRWLLDAARNHLATKHSAPSTKGD
jgi:hypothetical protein